MDGERCANTRITVRSISGRYFRERSVTVPDGRQTMLSTDRKKALEIVRLVTVRAMRAVFWESYGRKSSCGSLLILLTLTMTLLSPLKRR
jgi:hypothetical protein